MGWGGGKRPLNTIFYNWKLFFKLQSYEWQYIFDLFVFCFSVTLEVIDDDVFEPDEHFYIRLTQSQPAECLGSPTLATVIILDDDHGGLFK